MILVDDIVHSLSLINRFNGAAKFPYSVAQHSLYVAGLLPPELKLHGLLHDAPEAYVGDMVSPLKKIMTEYKEVEAGIARVVAEVLEMSWVEVRDRYSSELRALLANCPKLYRCD
jgi:5'-deoxynucleotidase YfbR-like HD superfamily hydrolase